MAALTGEKRQTFPTSFQKEEEDSKLVFYAQSMGRERGNEEINKEQ